MNIEMTSFYAVFLVSLLMVLTIRVLDLRQSPVTKFLHKKDRVVDPEVLKRAIRGHGNLTEYAPLFLILMLLAELNGLEVSRLHSAGVIFSIGRISHGICFCFMKRNLPLRIIGMAGTITGFLVLLRQLILLLFF